MVGATIQRLSILLVLYALVLVVTGDTTTGRGMANVGVSLGVVGLMVEVFEPNWEQVLP